MWWMFRIGCMQGCCAASIHSRLKHRFDSMDDSVLFGKFWSLFWCTCWCKFWRKVFVFLDIHLIQIFERLWSLLKFHRTKRYTGWKSVESCTCWCIVWSIFFGKVLRMREWKIARFLVFGSWIWTPISLHLAIGSLYHAHSSYESFESQSPCSFSTSDRPTRYTVRKSVQSSMFWYMKNWLVPGKVLKVWTWEIFGFFV